MLHNCASLLPSGVHSPQPCHEAVNAASPVKTNQRVDSVDLIHVCLQNMYLRGEYEVKNPHLHDTGQELARLQKELGDKKGDRGTMNP